MDQANPVNDALDEITEELFRAVEKFPTWPTDPLHAAVIVGEEFGELQQAILQRIYEPDKGTTIDDARKEALQLAAMSLRFLLSFGEYRFDAGEQHEQQLR
ncbi:MAG: hypothetical protein AAF394_06365 [Planctomycetota bacterium]